ncbi:MAG TPA: hypothetical protein VGY58_12865 [Gemmataceae bacterium]|nr:hypothetical protein [Gemmataceae bacterium]
MKRLAILGVLGGFTVLLTLPDATAQGDGKKDSKIQPAAKAQSDVRVRGTGVTPRASVVREGFTRPGNPPDEVLGNGKIRYVAWDPANREEVIGGTIYWMVLEQTGNETDSWGTGITRFNDLFREGKDFQSRYSPSLDTSAKYLYLYQLVNDRGLDPLPIKPAANTELPIKPIARSSLRLLVDPREITSWGYFKDLGFATEVVDRKFDGTTASAGLGEPDHKIRMAVSSNPSILAELPHEPYLLDSPAYPLGDLRDTFSVDRATIGLASSWAAKELKSNGVKYASWAKNELQALEHAMTPDYVLITVAGYDFNRGLAQGAEVVPPLLWGEERSQFVFQAYWDKDLVNLGQHSTIFGFTSNLPPVDEEIRIADRDALKRMAGQIRPAAAGEGAAPAEGVAPAGIAPGTAPTPAGAAAPGSSAPIGSLGGMPFGGGGGGGGGFPGGFGGGGFGAIGGFGSGGLGNTGGGVSGSSSSGGGGTAQQQQKQQQQQQGQTPTPQQTPVTVNVNVSNNNNSTNNNTNTNNNNNNNNNTNTNNNSNSNNNSNNNTNTNTNTTTPPAIPEPAAIMLAISIMPLLFLYWRRRSPATALPV